MTEALQDARHLGAPRLRAPLVVDPGNLAGRVHVFDQLDLRWSCRHGGETFGKNYITQEFGTDISQKMDS